MTTTVKVYAHCDSKTTEVRVIKGRVNDETRKNDETEYLQDGQEKDFVVHDDVYISVDEVPK